MVYTSDTNNQLNTHRASGMKEIGTNGKGLAVTSTNITLFSNGNRVGFIQSVSPSESRNIVKVQELGTEGVIQSVPSNTNGGQLSVSRLAVYNSNLFQALGLTRAAGTNPSEPMEYTKGDASSIGGGSYRTYGNPFKTLKDQRVPLEVVVRTTMPSVDTPRYLEEVYLDCWLSSYSKSIAANTITVTEQATIQYSDLYTNYV